MAEKFWTTQVGALPPATAAFLVIRNIRRHAARPAFSLCQH
jgi:hypothetical protein